MIRYVRKRPDYNALHADLASALGAKFLGIQGSGCEVDVVLIQDGQELTATELEQVKTILGFEVEKE